MKRNRSIRTLPLDNLNLLIHPLPETSNSYDHERLYFGEEIAKESPPSLGKSHLLSSDGSDFILTDVRDVGNSKSSSSSLSWGEGCKSEASKQVRDELERMDRVLRGVESIPDYYDQEEYKEWMTFFPNLCVLGKKTGTYREMKSKSVTDGEEILAIHPDSDCDTHTKLVIDQIHEKVSSAPKIKPNDSDSIDIDSYLKVSPLGGSLLNRRQSSSRSLISSQISSSKWLKDEEYNSLPFVPGSRNGRRGIPKGILKNSLVLPPIETNQFRSISATPRRETKSLSALSVKDQKYSGFKRKTTKDCK